MQNKRHIFNIGRVSVLCSIKSTSALDKSLAHNEYKYIHLSYEIFHCRVYVNLWTRFVHLESSTFTLYYCGSTRVFLRWMLSNCNLLGLSWRLTNQGSALTTWGPNNVLKKVKLVMASSKACVCHRFKSTSMPVLSYHMYVHTIKGLASSAWLYYTQLWKASCRTCEAYCF